MNFEDLVDMDWLSTHDEEPAPEGTTASEISLASLSKLYLEPPPTTCLEPTEPPPPDFAVPTTEQIRQLIEIAKRHLALRDQELHDETLQKLSQPETVAPDELVIKKSAERRPSCTEESLEAMAEAEGLDLKKLTPRERRQLRNKISARNFRVRRKEYITALEQEVEEYKRHVAELMEKLSRSEDENKKLRDQVERLTLQNQALEQQQQQQQQQQQTQQQHRAPSSPLSKPNLNKDIGLLGAKATDTYRQDTRILVSSAVMPDWNWKQILETDNWNCPLKPEERNFSDKQNQDSAYLEYLYDTLIMSTLISNGDKAKNFWWWS